MHTIQIKLLSLSTSTNLAQLKLREIGELVGEPHPQKVKHHIEQLFKKGFLKENLDKSVISRVDDYNLNSDMFISLPILGSANCGEAVIFAVENFEGYLHISRSYTKGLNPKNLFIIKAVGNSMNKASINSKNIEDGDFLVINKDINISLPELNNKYVLSIINGMANIKKFIFDKIQERILLISESIQDYSPIIIHKDDFDNYLVNGQVVEVIKKP